MLLGRVGPWRLVANLSPSPLGLSCPSYAMGRIALFRRAPFQVKNQETGAGDRAMPVTALSAHVSPAHIHQVSARRSPPAKTGARLPLLGSARARGPTTGRHSVARQGCPRYPPGDTNVCPALSDFCALRWGLRSMVTPRKPLGEPHGNRPPTSPPPMPRWLPAPKPSQTQSWLCKHHGCFF